jgi:SHS2 domain-containing protein
MTPYEELPHTADVRLRVSGRSLADLFAQAAEGMFALMNWRPGPPGEDVIEDVTLSAPGRETLLVDWLSELLYRSEADAICYTHFSVEPTRGEEMRALVRGLRGGAPIRFIKAVTYHDLDIVERADGAFEATITLDT